MISCAGCGSKKESATHELVLTLSTNKQTYQGENDLQIELQIAHQNPQDNLSIPYKDFNLQINVSQEGGTETSLLEYETFNTAQIASKKQTSSAVEKLTNLFQVADTDLMASTEKLKKIFTIIPKGYPTKIIITYKLVDSATPDEIVECTTTWTPQPVFNYELTLDGENTIIQAQAPDPIIIKIDKKGGAIEKSELASLTLQITRESGDAIIQGIEPDGTLKLTYLENDLVLQHGIIKKALTVIPNKSPETIFKLFLKYGTYTSKPITVIYTNLDIDSWQLELIGADPSTHTTILEDGSTDIDIKVYKVGNALLTEEKLKKLKLYIKRTTPGTATLAGMEDSVLELKDTNSLALAADSKSATKKLTINPGLDKTTSFELQLQDKMETNVGTIQKIIWKNGAQLESKVQYNVATKEITITVRNAGKLTLQANQAKLTWDTGHDTVTIDGNRQGKEDIGELKPAEEVIFLLKNVHFANPKQVPSTALTLELNWQKLENPLQKSHTLTATPLDITVSNLKFTKSTSQIIYNVKNNNNEDVTLQVRCINTKPSHENAALITTPLPINLNLTKAGNPGSDSGERTLQVDLEGEDRADFKFELLLGGHPINFKYKAKDDSHEKEVSQTLVTCKVEGISLKFTDSKNNPFPTEGIKLQGDNKEIKFKIGLNGNPGEVVTLNDIIKTQLKLLITTTNDAKIKQGPNTVTEIQGYDLNLGGENKLTIERATANQASFMFRLMYDIKGNGNFTKELATLPVSWEEDKFEIMVMNPIENNELIEKELASFILQNATGSTVPASIEIELKNHGGTIFQFAKRQGDNFSPVGYSRGTLEKILGSNTLIDKHIIGPIYFLMVDSNNKNNSEVSLVIRKDGYEIARTVQPIKWRTKKVDIRIASIQVERTPITDNLLLDNGSNKDATKAFTIILQNAGEDITTNDVQIELTNKNGVQFTLGKETGDIIEADLIYILGPLLHTNIPFPRGSTKEFTLRLSDNNPLPFTKITLIISSIYSGVLATKDLLWVNSLLIAEAVQIAKNLKISLDEIAGNVSPLSFGKILQNITDYTDIQKDKETLLRTLQGPLLDGAIDSDQKHIENSSIKEIVEKIGKILGQLHKINNEAEAANNGQEIEIIRQALGEVQSIYNQGIQILESKITEFVQKILAVGQKHLLQADIKKQPNGKMAEYRYGAVFLPLEEVRDKLLTSAIPIQPPAKNANHLFNLALKRISSIVAENQRIVAEKYKKEKDLENAEKFTKYAEEWQRGADSYTGVTL